MSLLRGQIFDRGTLGRKQTPPGYYGSAIIGRVNLQVAARLYYILRYVTLSMLYAYSARAHRADKRARDSCRRTRKSQGGPAAPTAIRCVHEGALIRTCFCSCVCFGSCIQDRGRDDCYSADAFSLAHELKKSGTDLSESSLSRYLREIIRHSS